MVFGNLDSKNGGESLRFQDGASKDKISELPESLILQILSFLPTKNVVATSVLSKRWRFFWKLVPKLKFASHDQNTDKFSENVTKCLLSHNAKILESLHITLVRDRCDIDIDIGIWLGIASSHHVRELVLLLLFEEPVRFPTSLFSFNTLETLKLEYSILVDVPYPVCMRSLKTLHLHSVQFKDYNSFCNLISGCTNLEDLVVRQGSFMAMLTFVIVSPSLKRIVIENYTGEQNNEGYVINAPCLKYLEIKGLKKSQCFFIENASELVEAKISNVLYIGNEKILGSLKSVKRLSLDVSPLEINCPTGTIFSQLVYLEMYTLKNEWWTLLALILDSSPKLGVLKIIDSSSHRPYVNFDKRNMDVWKWNQSKYVPECLLSHLETFVWIKYDWEREEQKEVATYVLENARGLKTATFSIKPIESKEPNKLEERTEMLNELARVKTSSSCLITFV